MKAEIYKVNKRTTPYNKALSVYFTDENNSYFETAEALRNDSIVATMASGIFKQYLIGKGFGEYDDVIIGNKRLYDIASDLVNDYGDIPGVFIHFNYNLNFEPSDFSVIPFTNCRIGEKDDKEYNDKILVCSDWSQEKISPSSIDIIDVFNPDKEVVKNQIEKLPGKTIREKILRYKGQILYFNNSPYIYPLARTHAVFLDQQNDYKTAVFKNNNLKNGFFGKKILITPPFIDNSLFADDSDEGIEKLRAAEKERAAFRKAASDFVTPENVGGFMHIETKFPSDADKIDDFLKVVDVKHDVNESLFDKTEEKALERILMAYNNQPIIFIKSSETSLLGNSGQAFIEAKKNYWELCEKPRNEFEYILNFCLQLLRDKDGEKFPYLSVKPLFEVTPENVLQKEKAQNDFRHSSAGGAFILDLKRSVNEGSSTKEEAVLILRDLLGIDEISANLMIGEPKSISAESKDNAILNFFKKWK